jgi:hypothetical protein
VFTLVSSLSGGTYADISTFFRVAPAIFFNLFVGPGN